MRRLFRKKAQALLRTSLVRYPFEFTNLSSQENLPVQPQLGC